MSIKTAVHTVLVITIQTSTQDVHLEHADNETIYHLLVQKTFCKAKTYCDAEDCNYVYSYIHTDVHDTKLKYYEVTLFYDILH
jgi:hypothetical protein